MRVCDACGARAANKREIERKRSRLYALAPRAFSFGLFVFEFSRAARRKTRFAVSEFRAIANRPNGSFVRLFGSSPRLRRCCLSSPSRSRSAAAALSLSNTRSPLPPSLGATRVGRLCVCAHGRPSTIWPRPRRCFAALRRSRRVCTRSRSACSNASLPPRVRRGAPPTRSALHDTHSRLSECARVCVVRLYVQRRSMRTANSARACSTTPTS